MKRAAERRGMNAFDSVIDETRSQVNSPRLSPHPRQFVLKRVMWCVSETFGTSQSLRSPCPAYPPPSLLRLPLLFPGLTPVPSRPKIECVGVIAGGARHGSAEGGGGGEGGEREPPQPRRADYKCDVESNPSISRPVPLRRTRLRHAQRSASPIVL